jgi:hypothetical protein
MHPEILRELTRQRGREMREQAHQAVIARAARRMLRATRRGIGAPDKADGFLAPAIPDYVDGSFRTRLPLTRRPASRDRSRPAAAPPEAALTRPPQPARSHPTGGGYGMSASLVPVRGSLSFRRIVDVPFETCVAALDSWQPTRHGGELWFGGSQLLGPMEHDRDLGTRRIQVRLARGPLRPPLRMRLDIDRWSSSSTALELIPCRLVRPTAAYFRAGRLLLDSLTRSLPQHLAPAHARDTASQPHAPVGSGRP